MIQTLNNGFYCDTISNNDFLGRNIKLYWRYNYISSNFIGGSVKDQQMSEDIRTLKNQFRDKKFNLLQSCYQRIRADVNEGLQILADQFAVMLPCVVVAVPRSKATFRDDQLFLIKAISDAVTLNGMENGAYFIKRYKDTKTTHLMKTKKFGDMNTTGEAPYPGITKDTCNLEGSVLGKNVILVDDIYTSSVNIDEDCAQFLFDNGAANVVLYTLCKT